MARTGRRHCATLDGLLTGWDGVLTVLWRKRIARHIESCAACGGTKRREVRASALLATIPFVALPLALRDRVLTAAADPQLVANRIELAAQAGRFDRNGFPRSAGAARKAGLAAPPRRYIPGAATVLVVGGLLLFLQGSVGDLLEGPPGPTTAAGPAAPSTDNPPAPADTSGRLPTPQPTNQPPQLPLPQSSLSLPSSLIPPRLAPFRWCPA